MNNQASTGQTSLNFVKLALAGGHLDKAVDVIRSMPVGQYRTMSLTALAGSDLSDGQRDYVLASAAFLGPEDRAAIIRALAVSSARAGRRFSSRGFGDCQVEDLLNILEGNEKLNATEEVISAYLNRGCHVEYLAALQFAGREASSADLEKLLDNGLPADKRKK